MGKKKKNKEQVQVYCWYCERKFEDEKVLVAHQKAKHFKCHVCHKKLTTAGGMVVHVFQVHKENITKVPNAKAGRDSVKYEIYGMEGIPDEDGEEEGGPSKKQKVETTVPSVPLLPTPSFIPTPGQPNLFTPAPVPGQFPPVPGFAPFPGPWGAGGMLPPPQPHLQNFPTPGTTPSALQPPLSIPPTAAAPQNGARPPPLFPIQNPPVPAGAPNFYPPPSAAANPPGAFPAYAAPGPSLLPSPTQPPQQSLLQTPPRPQPQYVPPQPQQPDAYLVYDDESMSMEEKRAELARYRYDEESLKQQMNKIDQSIEFRVSQMIGSRVGM